MFLGSIRKPEKMTKACFFRYQRAVRPIQTRWLGLACTVGLCWRKETREVSCTAGMTGWKFEEQQCGWFPQETSVESGVVWRKQRVGLDQQNEVAYIPRIKEKNSCWRKGAHLNSRAGLPFKISSTLAAFKRRTLNRWAQNLQRAEQNELLCFRTKEKKTARLLIKSHVETCLRTRDEPQQT